MLGDGLIVYDYLSSGVQFGSATRWWNQGDPPTCSRSVCAVRYICSHMWSTCLVLEFDVISWSPNSCPISLQRCVNQFLRLRAPVAYNERANGMFILVFVLLHRFLPLSLPPSWFPVACMHDKAGSVRHTCNYHNFSKCKVLDIKFAIWTKNTFPGKISISLEQ